MKELVTLQFDGGSRGNPGPSGVGVVLRAADDTPLVTLGRYIGRATNNAAEYRALILGLEEARKLGVRRIRIRGDSELIVRQLKGVYRVKHPDLRVLFDQVQELLKQFDHVEIEHNLRHRNKLADKLANLAMDRKADVTDVDESEDESPLDTAASAPPKAGDRFACPRCGCVIALVRPSSIRPHQLRSFVCQCGAKMHPAPGSA